MAMVSAAILRNLFEVNLGGGSPGVAACVGNPGLRDAAPSGQGIWRADMKREELLDIMKETP
jgi:hypothetical protein